MCYVIWRILFYRGFPSTRFRVHFFAIYIVSLCEDYFDTLISQYSHKLSHTYTHTQLEEIPEIVSEIPTPFKVCVDKAGNILRQEV